MKNLKLFNSYKTDHDKLLEYQARGRQVRLCVESTEMNEKSNAYFFNREKYEFEKKTIDSIITDEGTLVTDEKI